MNDSNYYKDKIKRLVYSIDDDKSLEMIYMLLSKLLAIDDESILNMAIRLITGITNKWP